jgi:hypothetical protein
MDAIDSTQLADWYTAALPVTYTLQQQDGEGGVVPVSIAPGRDMMVSALVKFDNRRKHNSHEWCAQTFANIYRQYLQRKSLGRKLVFDARKQNCRAYRRFREIKPLPTKTVSPILMNEAPPI